MITPFRNNSYRWSPTALILIVVLAGVSLMNAEPASTTRQFANDMRTDSAFSQSLIVDPNTGLRFEKVCGITSTGELVEYKRGVDLSFDGKFFTYGEHVILGIKDEDLRDLVGFPACRPSWSPDRTMIAFYADGIWLLPLAPESGEPTGPARKLVNGNYWYGPKVEWSPDSEKIVYVSNRTGHLIGGLLDPVWGRCFDMKWSPDGLTLGLILEAKPESTGVTEDISGNTRLFTVSMPKGRWTELAGKEGTNYHHSWSPDGQWIAYNSEEWVITRAADILWEVEVNAFLRKAAERDSSSEAAIAKPAKQPNLRKIRIPTKP